MNINATLFGQALWFAVFIWLTMKYIWPPLQKAMKDREKQIADGLAASEKGRQELEQAAQRVKERLVKANVPILGVVLNRKKYHIPRWLYKTL